MVGKKIVHVFGRRHQDQVRRRLLQNLQQRIGSLFVRSIEAVDQKHAPPSAKGAELRALLQSRICWIEICRRGPSGGKVTKSRCEAKSSGSSERLSAGSFSRSAITDHIFRKAEVVALDFLMFSKDRGCESPDQGRLAYSFRSVQKYCLRDAVLPESSAPMLRRRRNCRRSCQT